MLGAKKGPEVEQTLTFTCRSVDSSVILSIRIGEVSDAMRLRVGALDTVMGILPARNWRPSIGKFCLRSITSVK